MSSTYERSPLRHALNVERERISSIPLRGIAQIPAEADVWWKTRGDWELPLELQAKCDAQIAAAMAEHKLRREAIKQGLDLFPDDAEMELSF